MILTGETGRNELLVLVFREPNEIDFYQRFWKDAEILPPEI